MLPSVGVVVLVFFIEVGRVSTYTGAYDRWTRGRARGRTGGLDGYVDYMGIRHPFGAIGVTGTREYTGRIGLSGNTGDKGIMGRWGPAAPKGFVGPPGYKRMGVTGKNGMRGQAGGRTGATGGTGPRGNDGRTGSTGPPGLAARIPPAESRAVVTLELVWLACLTLALSVLTTFLLMRYRRVMDDLQDQRYNFRVQFVATSRVPSVAMVASTDTQATEICDWNIPPQADGKSVKTQMTSA